MTVHVRYYAKLKEEAARGDEVVETVATTVAALWAELADRHGFTLAPDLIRAAQGDEFCAWDALLVPGSAVVFMPPVAGG